MYVSQTGRGYTGKVAWLLQTTKEKIRADELLATQATHIQCPIPTTFRTESQQQFQKMQWDAVTQGMKTLVPK